MTKRKTIKAEPFDIYKFLEGRPLSWSALSSFEYSPEQWYQKYIKKIEQPPNHEMIFGKNFAKSIETGTCTVTELMAKLNGKKEHQFLVMFGKIKMIGFADDFDVKTLRVLNEVKTGKTAWTQKRADGHGQFDMYLLMNYITSKVKPEEVACFLHWVRTMDNGDFTITFTDPVQVVTFETRRTMAQMLTFGARINRAVTGMQSYVEAKLSTEKTVSK
jgi:hypothetical protein